MTYLDSKKGNIIFSISGSEAEYTAIMKALSIAIGSMDDNSNSHISARKTLSGFLVDILPDENNVQMTEANNTLN